MKDYDMKRSDEGMPFLLKYENVAWYADGQVRILDRRIFPTEVRFVICKRYQDVVTAIRNMVTQSAGPYTAVGMGMALAAHEALRLHSRERADFLTTAAGELGHARPTTASRYRLITTRCLSIALQALADGEDPSAAIVADTLRSLNRRYDTMQKVADFLLSRIEAGSTVLTQCYGETIIGALIRAAKKENKPFKVICAETRPFLQGARLTASCFAEAGFDTTVITDNMVADTMRREKIGLFTSAADTITEDGWIVNKIGTYQIALLAKHFDIPYYATGIPDKGTRSLSEVHIEMRDPAAVLSIDGKRHTLQSVKGRYPAFDCTPPALVTGIVTDTGILEPTALQAYFEQKNGGSVAFY